MSERKAGWYWVQVSPLISETWEAARHAGGQWFMADRAGPLSDGVIHTVGPSILTPDELTVLRKTVHLAERCARAKGRYHGQHAMCDLMNHFGVPCVRPGEDAEMATCACGDSFPIESYGAGFMAANGGMCENCAAAEGVGDE